MKGACTGARSTPLSPAAQPALQYSAGRAGIAEVRFGVKTGKAQCEHMFSALPLRADIAQQSRHVRFVPEAEVRHHVGLHSSSSCPIASAQKMTSTPAAPPAAVKPSQVVGRRIG